MQNNVVCIATRRTTLHKKRQKTIKKTSQNPLKLMVGALQNAPPKNDHNKSQQKSQKCRKSTILGTPNFGERTRVEPTFRHFLGSGFPWGTPRARNGPKTSPKCPRDPPKPQLLTIFDQYFVDFGSIFDLFRVAFLLIWLHVSGSLFGATREQACARRSLASVAKCFLRVQR